MYSMCHKFLTRFASCFSLIFHETTNLILKGEIAIDGYWISTDQLSPPTCICALLCFHLQMKQPSRKLRGEERIFNRVRVLALHKAGLKPPRIAVITGTSQSTIRSIIRTYGKRKSVRDRPRSGRPKLRTPAGEELAREFARDKRVGSVRRVQDALARRGHAWSRMSVWRAVRATHTRAVRPQRRPKLRTDHTEARKEFATTYLDCAEEDWMKWCFQDEKWFLIGGSPRFVWIGDDEEIPTIPTGQCHCSFLTTPPNYHPTRAVLTCKVWPDSVTSWESAALLPGSSPLPQ
jgi:transposase